MTNVIKSRLIGSNYDDGRFTSAVDRIVLHTMVGSIESAEARFNNPAAEVSAHYGIARDDPRIWNWVNPQDTAWHAGNWPMNLRSVGIEHEDHGEYDEPRPLDMYLRSAWLIQQVAQWFDIPIDRAHIRDHRQVSATACPDALDTDRLIALAAAEVPMAEIFTKAQQAFIDLRIREVTMAEDIAPYALYRFLTDHGVGKRTTGQRKAAPRREPATHMRGKVPAKRKR